MYQGLPFIRHIKVVLDTIISSGWFYWFKNFLPPLSQLVEEFFSRSTRVLIIKNKIKTSKLNLFNFIFLKMSFQLKRCPPLALSIYKSFASGGDTGVQYWRICINSNADSGRKYLLHEEILLELHFETY